MQHCQHGSSGADTVLSSLAVCIHVEGIDLLQVALIQVEQTSEQFRKDVVPVAYRWTKSTDNKETAEKQAWTPLQYLDKEDNHKNSK